MVTISTTMAANQAAQFQMIMQHQQQQRMMYGGGYPSYPPTWNQNNWNLNNAVVGHHGFLGLEATRGFAVDLNGDGRYNRGQDGVLAMDLNRDGRVDRREIEESRKLINSVGGNFDLNGDGRVSLCERFQGRGYQNRAREMGLDADGDGRISSWEFAQSGGRVLKDHNRDGNFQPWEQHSPFNFPTPGFGRGRLNGIDPFWGTTNTTQTGWGWGPPVPPWGPRPYGY